MFVFAPKVPVWILILTILVQWFCPTGAESDGLVFERKAQTSSKKPCEDINHIFCQRFKFRCEVYPSIMFEICRETCKWCNLPGPPVETTSSPSSSITSSSTSTTSTTSSTSSTPTTTTSSTSTSSTSTASTSTTSTTSSSTSSSTTTRKPCEDNFSHCRKYISKCNLFPSEMFKECRKTCKWCNRPGPPEPISCQNLPCEKCHQQYWRNECTIRCDYCAKTWCDCLNCEKCFSSPSDKLCPTRCAECKKDPYDCNHEPQWMCKFRKIKKQCPNKCKCFA